MFVNGVDKTLGTPLNKPEDFVEAEPMVELLYWIALDFTGVPNKAVYVC